MYHQALVSKSAAWTRYPLLTLAADYVKGKERIDQLRNIALRKNVPGVCKSGEQAGI